MKKNYSEWDDSCYCNNCGKEMTTYEELKNGVCGECLRKKQQDKYRRYARRKGKTDMNFAEEIGEEEE